MVVSVAAIKQELLIVLLTPISMNISPCPPSPLLQLLQETLIKDELWHEKVRQSTHFEENCEFGEICEIELGEIVEKVGETANCAYSDNPLILTNCRGSAVYKCRHLSSSPN